MAIAYGENPNLNEFYSSNLTAFIEHPQSVKQSSPKKPYEDKGASLTVLTLSIKKPNLIK